MRPPLPTSGKKRRGCCAYTTLPAVRIAFAAENSVVYAFEAGGRDDASFPKAHGRMPGSSSWNYRRIRTEVTEHEQESRNRAASPDRGRIPLR